MEFTKHYYNEINIKEKSREDGIMSLEWVVATAATLIAVVAGLYTIFNNADKRKRTIQSDGECIAKQTSATSENNAIVVCVVRTTPPYYVGKIEETTGRYDYLIGHFEYSIHGIRLLTDKTVQL